MDQTEINLQTALSILVHVMEYNETGEPLDVLAAKGAYSGNASLQQWIVDNGALIPRRRDGQSITEALDRMGI